MRTSARTATTLVTRRSSCSAPDESSQPRRQHSTGRDIVRAGENEATLLRDSEDLALPKPDSTSSPDLDRPALDCGIQLYQPEQSPVSSRPDPRLIELAPAFPRFHRFTPHGRRNEQGPEERTGIVEDVRLGQIDHGRSVRQDAQSAHWLHIDSKCINAGQDLSVMLTLSRPTRSGASGGNHPGFNAFMGMGRRLPRSPAPREAPHPIRDTSTPLSRVARRPSVPHHAAP